MLDLLIIIVLIASLIVGIRRGLIVQAIHLLGVAISFIIAWIYYKPLSDHFEMLIPYPGVTSDTDLILSVADIDVDRTFYRLFAFVLIFIVAKMLLQVIASMFHKFSYLPVLKDWNRIGGAILAFIEFYIVMFMVLYLLAMLPLSFITSRLENSFFVGLIVEYTPILTAICQKLWYLYV
ncbi:CvpA family protein [Caryophanon tenue]|uniref:Colicin V production protein n=1 Tax=Caryophanon tenue TaxID=33978 RepID=A0A1C0YMI4_9BACL|nr:CvpA family protein [Caryophanon tenue]OCS88386.1 hypothetical protein A6M13_00640 [Caryophanon tenue]